MNSTAIIKSSPEGQHVIAGMTVQMRMIKLLISQGFSRIIVERPDLPDIDREDAAPLSDLQVIAANERTAQVQYAAPEDISQSHGDIIAKDSYILHPDVLNGFLNARHTQLIGSDHDVVLTKAVSKPDQHEAFPYQNWQVIRVQSNQLKYAKKQLFRYLCKDGDGLVSRHINRPISTFISRYLVDLNVTPIHCTALTVLCAVIMVAALIYAPVIGIFWGCLMFQVASVVDGLDGEIARVQFTATARGAKLDTGIDMATNILFTVGVSYALWQIHGEDFLALGLIAISLAVLGVVSMTAILAAGPGGGSFDILAKTIRQRVQGRPFLMVLFKTVNIIVKRDMFAFVFACIAATGFSYLIIYIFIGGLLVWNAALFYNAGAMLRFKSV